MPPESTNDLLTLGRSFAQTGHPREAEEQFLRLLVAEPNHAEALAFVLRCAMSRADHELVVALLERAITAGLVDPQLCKVLVHAHLSLGDPAAAQALLARHFAFDDEPFRLRLGVGQAFEAAGESYAALTVYFRALTDAQKQGFWKNDATTEPNFRAPVRHAIAFVKQGRSRLFRDLLAPLRNTHGAASLTRIEHCLAAYLGEVPLVHDHPLQRPTFLHVPGLPPVGFHSRELFPWLDDLEAHAEAIRAEALAVLEADSSLEPFLGETDAVASGQLSNARGTPTWNAFFFYRHGKRYDNNCTRCPVTTSVIERLPLVRIHEHAPEILFSVLTPGSHILPHTGVTNSRLVTHLALIIPSGCAIRVGDQRREWEEGRGFVFDDTFEHEAWNEGDETRVVLIIDIWNPHLTEVEREALSLLVPAIGKFLHDCGFPSGEETLEEYRKRKAAAS